MKCSFTSLAHSTKAPKGNELSAVTISETATRSSTPSSSSSIPPALVQVEPYANVTHVELFYWLLEGGEWAFEGEKRKMGRPHVLKHAFAHPFLLIELLAISALHLSTRRPTQQAFYREEATRLQSQALRLFNETMQDLNLSNIIPVFLFSALQGIATFYETFHAPTYETSDGALFENIVQSVRLLQGVRSIVGSWWNFLCTSDIKDILDEDPTPNLEWSDEFVNQLETFRVHILQSTGLDQTQAAVCDNAIEELIWVYKSTFGNESEYPLTDQAAAKYATQWLILIPQAYTELLVERKPEALVILGHFAAVLHKLRGFWTVGDAGRQLLSVVEAHLEEPWHAAISWPKSFVEGD